MSVQITCPKCSLSKTIPKEKVPTGARWATCPRCRHRFELVLQEEAFDIGYGDKETAAQGRVTRVTRQPPPWEGRASLGLWQGIYKTFKAVLFSPKQIFGAMTYLGGIREPLAFGLLFGSIGGMFAFFWQFLMMSGGLMGIAFDVMSHFTMPLIFFGIIVVIPLFVTLTLFMTSAILHFMLFIVRGGKNGFEATFRVVSYAQATQIWGLIPLFGGLIGGLWFLIVGIIGLREIHETSYLRVILALLILLVGVFCLVRAIVISLSMFFAIL